MYVDRSRIPARRDRTVDVTIRGAIPAAGLACGDWNWSTSELQPAALELYTRRAGYHPPVRRKSLADWGQRYPWVAEFRRYYSRYSDIRCGASPGLHGITEPMIGRSRHPGLGPQCKLAHAMTVIAIACGTTSGVMNVAAGRQQWCAGGG